MEANTADNRGNNNPNPNTPNNQSLQPPSQEEAPQFNADGSMYFPCDDVIFSDIENHAWIERAMVEFFGQTGYRRIDVPYFANRKGFDLTDEMRKINEVMIKYCAFCIPALLKKSIEKSPVTGKKGYNITKALELMFNEFNAPHIILGIKDHWPSINVKHSVKTKLYNGAISLWKRPKSKPKRPSPQDDFKRLKAKEDAKAAMAEGAGGDNEQSEKKTISRQNMEIMSIIKTYKKGLNKKSEKSESDLPSMKDMMEQKK